MALTMPSDPLAELAAIATELGDAGLEADAHALAARVAEGRFYVACVGQFKRGKSTLINALMERPLLPTGVLPVTTVPVILRYGAVVSCRVRIEGAWRETDIEAIATYVSEAENPGNAAGVEAVEVFVPAPLLSHGLCLVDMPGVASVSAVNSTAAHAFVPQIDAAIAVVGADPPIGGDEVALIVAIAAHARDIVVVLNKADRVTAADAQVASAFAQRVLSERLGRPVEQVIHVSAADRLAGIEPDRDWSALVRWLESLVERSGRGLVLSGLGRGVVRLGDEALRQIEEAQDTLLRPLEESERRLDDLRRCVADVAHRSLQLGHLWEAEQAELGRRFARRREDFLAHALPEAGAELERVIAAMRERRGPAVRRRAMALARDVARQLIEPWLAEEQEAAEAAYRETAAGFVTLCNVFLERVIATKELPTHALPSALPSERGFRTGSRFYFHELPALAQGAPIIDWWRDQLRSPRAARRAARRTAGDYLLQLIEMNATRIANDLDERVLESRRRLEAELHALLDGVYASADRALTRARVAQAAGADTVRADVARLRTLRHEVERIVTAAPSYGTSNTPYGRSPTGITRTTLSCTTSTTET